MRGAEGRPGATTGARAEARAGARPEARAGGVARRLAALAVALPVMACGGDGGTDGRGADDPVPGDGDTERMAAVLDSLARSQTSRDPDASQEQLAELRREGPGPGLRGRAVYLGQVAEKLLHMGRTDEAVETYEELRSLVEENVDVVPMDFQLAAHDLLGAAYLHRAQERNCVGEHAIPRCRVPVGSAGVHPDPEPARAAAREYRWVLERAPEDMNAVWLLNLAAMMAGDHPEGVPERWRIPRAAFEPEGELGPLPDVAPALGVNHRSLAGGAIAEDFDGDGDLDLLATGQSLRDTIRYWRNEREEGFVDATREAGLEGITGGLYAVQADYDNDGDADVLVVRGGWMPDPQPNSLLRNDGDGRFTDVTRQAGLLEPWRTGQVGAWADYDGDGWLDLFIGAEVRDPDSLVSQLFHNDGDGTFTEVAAEVGLDAVGFVKGADWGDYDDDGRPDLYVSRHGQPNLLFHNDGPDGEGGWSFTEVAARAGVEEPLQSFPTWFFDYDNDGRLDLFVAGFGMSAGDQAGEYLGRDFEAVRPRLYRNRGDGTFEDVTAEAGLDRAIYPMGSNHGDVDGDGWEEILVGTGNPDFRTLIPNRLFRNARGRGFRDVTVSAGVGTIFKGHAVAFGDLDGDGDQDVYQSLGGAYDGDDANNALFLNPGHGNRWITLRLVGREANRSGVGARIRAVVEAGGRRRTVHVTAGTGGSFGANSLQQEIGLGDARSLDTLEIRWPGSGTVDVFTDVPLDRVLEVREGADSVGIVPADSFPLPAGRSTSP